MALTRQHYHTIIIGIIKTKNSRKKLKRLGILSERKRYRNFITSALKIGSDFIFSQEIVKISTKASYEIDRVT